MPKYYSVIVSLETEDSRGKIRKVKEQYIVNSLSCTEAEARLVEKFTKDKVTVDYEVVSVTETKIVDIIK